MQAEGGETIVRGDLDRTITQDGLDLALLVCGIGLIALCLCLDESVIRAPVETIIGTEPIPALGPVETVGPVKVVALPAYGTVTPGTLLPAAPFVPSTLWVVAIALLTVRTPGVLTARVAPLSPVVTTLIAPAIPLP